MFLNRLWADWEKYLHFYLSGTVMVTIESQWYSAETHCEQGPGVTNISKIGANMSYLSLLSVFSENKPAAPGWLWNYTETLFDQMYHLQSNGKAVKIGTNF